MTTWQKTIMLYLTESHLMPGDPDGPRLAGADSQGCVLHSLLTDGWVIRDLQPAVGGPVFALLEKTIPDGDIAPDGRRAANPKARLSPGLGNPTSSPTTAGVPRGSLGLRELPSEARDAPTAPG